MRTDGGGVGDGVERPADLGHLGDAEACRQRVMQRIARPAA
jgi:hypothetical protein